MSLKIVVRFLQYLSILLVLRPYGNIIHDLASKYQGWISLQDLRQLEKLSVKKRKAELDVSFLRSCKTFNVFPKFICFPLPNTNRFDVLAIRKRLLRSAISKRQKELNKLSCDCDNLTERVKNSLNSVDWYLLNKALTKMLTRTSLKSSPLIERN